MDRNTVIGFILIALILFSYSFYQSQFEEKNVTAQSKDSLLVADSLDVTESLPIENNFHEEVAVQTTKSVGSTNDSISMQQLSDQYGKFAVGAIGSDTNYILENNKVKLTIAAKGAQVISIELKDYFTHDSLPLELCNENETGLTLSFFSNNRNINTGELYFKLVQGASFNNGGSSGSLTFHLELSNNQYLEYTYSLQNNSYMADFNIKTVGLGDVIQKNTTFLAVNWWMDALQTEQDLAYERQNATVYYKFLDDEVDYLSATSETETEVIGAKLAWISFKKLFFSSVLIADELIESPEISYTTDLEKNKQVKQFNTNFNIPYQSVGDNEYSFKFYYGPNHYQTLKRFDIGLEKQIDLGWTIFGWFNRFLIIPIFNFLNGFISNYGIIILILTVIIKSMLFPLTYKSYLSSAKMKVLKPEVDELSKKFPKPEDAMKKQTAVMGLYRQAGVNPMGGCLPMLLQMPILIAMYRFFPASIELRQESFLWANDLSTYDSIFSLPFEIPMYGDHVSLFTLLMTVTTVISMKFNNQQMAGNPQAEQMKIMMYMMPVMFMVFLNSFSAGLTYYYFLANLISIGQNLLMKQFVDEKAILKKIETHKKKPKSTKKSGFQKRLEDMAKKKGVKLK